MPIISLQATKKQQGGDSEPAPELLAVQGPVIPVVLSVLDETSKALMESKQKPPDPINGFALIDTGATSTCVDRDSARRAFLPTRGVANMASASHPENEAELFAGKIVLHNTVAINVPNAMGVNLSGFPGLIALIGRDTLQNCVMVYNGRTGSIDLAY